MKWKSLCINCMSYRICIQIKKKWTVQCPLHCGPSTGDRSLGSVVHPFSNFQISVLSYT
jgi:hypothetical protein